jgi:putative SOS response-associated peptidase YedK
MCGRFVVNERPSDLARLFVAEDDYPDMMPTFSIAPTDVIPIVRERPHSDTGELRRQLEPAVWNFRPSFMRESKRPQFNSRVETVATNGLWKGAFVSGRCIVPMSGYYEWTGEPGAKVAHYLHSPEIPTLAAAGIATARKLDSGDWEVSASIITREARDASGEVHDRMPVYVRLDSIDHYLEPDKLDPADMQAMVDFLISESDQVAPTIVEHIVDPRVNNSRRVDPADASLIQPIS